MTTLILLMALLLVLAATFTPILPCPRKKPVSLVDKGHQYDKSE